MQIIPRITVEVPVLGIGAGPPDYEELGRYVRALRRPQGLHMTLLHLGVLEVLAGEIEDWTDGRTDSHEAASRTVAWLRALPVLEGFAGATDRLIVLGGGNIFGLEVQVPRQVHEFRIFLVQGLRELLDDLLVDNVDDFILGSRALGWHPRWLPHVAVGRPLSRDGAPAPIPPLSIGFGESRIRNAESLP